MLDMAEPLCGVLSAQDCCAALRLRTSVWSRCWCLKQRTELWRS